MSAIPVAPLEVDTYRHEAVINQSAGAIVFKNSSGREVLSIAHRGGASLVFANGITSEFNPNNKQINTQGDNFTTTKGSNYDFTFKNKEVRVIGDHNIITGSPAFFNNTVAPSYIEKSAEIAEAMCTDTTASVKIGNNTRAEYAETRNENIAQTIQEVERELTEIANSMGEGGNLNLLSCKHIYIQAGTAPVGFDSGVFHKDENGREVDMKTAVTGTAAAAVLLPETTFVPQYDEVNTTANIPFGDIIFNAATKINMQAGAGGIDIKSLGSTKIGGSGLTTIGGAQVMIGAANDTDLGSVYIASKYTELTSPEGNINIIASSTHIKTGSLTINAVEGTSTVVIQGDLIVDGNIIATGNINAGGDVVAGTVSLLAHTHRAIGLGAPTSAPIPGSGVPVVLA